jgi:hypothetical protein
MATIQNWWLQAWAEHSIAFVFFSAVVGGVVGAATKFFFEAFLPESLKARREAARAFDKYRSPIARSAGALRDRINNFLKMQSLSWFESSEYYRFSTLYVFCCFFAWQEILFGRVVHLRFESRRRNRRLNVMLNFVDKTFNNRRYFNDLKFTDIPDDTDVPKFVCKALGELTVDYSSQTDPCPISFAKFCEECRVNPQYRGWIKILSDFLTETKKSKENLKWDRLHMVELALTGLVNFLDPMHEQTRPYSRNEIKLRLDGILRECALRAFLHDVHVRRLPLNLDNFVATFLEQRRAKVAKVAAGEF